uniref:Putative secreted protein n=1 Tax=Rhipicephalus microplus TaxID=6941 RepID=A0A6G5A2S6_RHIMP
MFNGIRSLSIMNYILHIVLAQNKIFAELLKTNYIIEISVKAFICTVCTYTQQKIIIALDYRLKELFL